MAVEAKRGCGYRKIGGTYLVSGPGGIPCDRLPFPLTVCPTCSCGIKQTRGWTWINPRTLFGGVHMDCSDDRHRHHCPVCAGTIEKAGLVWIGEKFYKTPEAFMYEGAALGFSRRVTAIPRGFKVGATWVLMAHPKTIELPRAAVVAQIEQEMSASLGEQVTLGPDHDVPQRFQAGIFFVWKPERIEKILPESARFSDEVKELEEKGITPVFVPDDDPDHRGTVYDKDDETELTLNV